MNENFNARWRKYICQDCGNIFEVFTRDPVPLEKHTCYLCQKQHITVRAYANSLGCAIQLQGADHGEPGKQPELCEPFVIVGKAKRVFRAIELKAQYQQEAGK